MNCVARPFCDRKLLNYLSSDLQLEITILHEILLFRGYRFVPFPWKVYRAFIFIEFSSVLNIIVFRVFCRMCVCLISVNLI